MGRCEAMPLCRWGDRLAGDAGARCGDRFERCRYLRFLPLPEAGLQARLHLRPLPLQDAENDRLTEGAILAPHIATEYALASGRQLGDSCLRADVQGVCLDLDASVPAVVETVSHQQQFGFGVALLRREGLSTSVISGTKIPTGPVGHVAGAEAGRPAGR